MKTTKKLIKLVAETILEHVSKTDNKIDDIVLAGSLRLSTFESTWRWIIHNEGTSREFTCIGQICLKDLGIICLRIEDSVKEFTAEEIGKIENLVVELSIK